MDAILDPIIRSPKLMLYVEELERLRDEEQARRENFWDEVREDEKAEFINGEVIVQPPAKARHMVVGGRLLSVLSAYVRVNHLGLALYEKAMISLTRNDYEPDICFWSQEKALGIRPEQGRFPAPDLAIEVLSEGTEERDRGVKHQDYAAHGVSEYWIVDTVAETIEQYLLEEGRYALALKLKDGTLESRAVAEFHIPVRAIFDDEANLNTLREILAAQ